MKNRITIISLLFIITNLAAMACPICEKQQPKVLQGITHGAGPQSNWDWLIIAIITIITLLTLFYSLKYLIKPGENNANHIKQSILNL